MVSIAQNAEVYKSDGGWYVAREFFCDTCHANDKKDYYWCAFEYT